MRTPHKHADVIKAWADGAQIQFRSEYSNGWEDCIHDPIWYDDTKYRVKPDVKYRVGVIKHHTTGGEIPFLVSNSNMEGAYENSVFFIRWITDWIAVETGGQ